MKNSGWLGRWSRRYFVLRRRSLAFYASYHAYSTGGEPLQAARVVFVRLPEGDFGEARVLIGTRSTYAPNATAAISAASSSSAAGVAGGGKAATPAVSLCGSSARSARFARGAGKGQGYASKNNAPWLVQPDNRSEQCRWVNALWWALEPTEDELRQLQVRRSTALLLLCVWCGLLAASPCLWRVACLCWLRWLAGRLAAAGCLAAADLVWLVGQRQALTHHDATCKFLLFVSSSSCSSSSSAIQPF